MIVLFGLMPARRQTDKSIPHIGMRLIYLEAFNIKTLIPTLQPALQSSQGYDIQTGYHHHPQVHQLV